MPIQRRAAIVILLAGLASGLAGAARADDAGDGDAGVGQEQQTLERYGAANIHSCEGWTDGCAICVRRADGTLGCSRLGVDCHISDIQCTQRSRDPTTGKTPPAE